jgi:hypothetical protein
LEKSKKLVDKERREKREERREKREERSIRVSVRYLYTESNSNISSDVLLGPV